MSGIKRKEKKMSSLHFKTPNKMNVTKKRRKFTVMLNNNNNNEKNDDEEEEKQ